MAERKRDWRQESASRGIKLVVYMLPILLAALYSQSKTTSPLMIDSPTFKSEEQTIAVPKTKILQTGRIALIIPKISKNLSKASFVFLIEGRREKFTKRGSVILGKPLVLKDRRLKKDRTYGLKVKLNKRIYQKLKGRSWQLKVLGLQPRRDFTIFDMLTTLVYPSLAFVLIGSTMILAPRMVG